MKTLVYTDSALCIGCNRCSRECLFPLTNHTYLDEKNQIKVEVDSAYCISCGLCINVCAHKARIYSDDLDIFFDDLKKGKKITLFLAPSFMTNFSNYKKYISMFKSLGVEFVYDVSFGASLNIWAHLKYLESHKNEKFITQPCPAIVNYAKIYNQELFKYFIPIKSPMLSLATYINKVNGKSNIAAITPCLAKKGEFEESNLIDYNITFDSLIEYTKNINMDSYNDSTCDTDYVGLGSIFSLPGGLKENIEFFNKDLFIQNIEGSDVYKRLDEYVKTDKKYLPDILDVLNCSLGCNFGPAGNKDNKYFVNQNTMNKFKSNVINKDNVRQSYINLFKEFDKTQDLNDYIFSYSFDKNFVIPKISDSDIEKAFSSLLKFTFEDRHIDCGSCGSNSCSEMAYKIAAKVNIKENCIMLTKDILIKEKAQSDLLLYKTNKYISLIKEISNTYQDINSTNTYQDNIKQSLTIVSTIYANSSIFLVEEESGVYFSELSVIANDLLNEKDASDLINNFPQLISDPDSDIISWNFNKNEINSNIKNTIKSYFIIKIRTNHESFGYFFMLNNHDIKLMKGDIDVLVSCATLIFTKYKEYQTSLKLTESRELALSLSKAKTEFLSKMSHEMRTPLNAIINMTYISKQTSDPDKLQHFLNNISYSSEHLLGIINDILDYSSIEGQKLVLNNSVFNIEDLAKKIDSLFSIAFISKQQTFKIYMPYSLGRYYIGDYFRITQIISNLVSNANKYTREGGLVKLVFESEKLDFETMNLKISVIDNGIGMNKHQYEVMFSPFVQANMDNSIVSSGSGLGLSICKGLALAMNGTITVESKETIGSTFNINIPLKIALNQRINFDLSFKDINVIMLTKDHMLITNNINIGLFNEFDYVLDVDSLLRRCDNHKYHIIIIDFECIDITKSIDSLSQFHDKIICIGNNSTYQQYDDLFKEHSLKNQLSYPLINDDFLSSIYIMSKEISTTCEESSKISFEDKYVLLVDDVLLNREVVKYLLEDTSIMIDEAVDGMQGYLKFKENQEKYSVILMDIQMPVLNGYEATVKIRELGTKAALDIPIIAITANTYKEDIDKAFESGMNAHLGKPIDHQALLNTLAKYIN